MKKKLCRKCGKEKFLEEMVRDRRRPDGYEFRCKKCLKKYSKQYAIKNKKKIGLCRKKYREEHKKEIAIRDKKYREENKEVVRIRRSKYHKKNREKIVARIKKWRKTKRGNILHNLSCHRRNQRKKNLSTDHDLTNDEWQYILESQDNRCVGFTEDGPCNRSFKRFKSTIDHIYPLELGGLLVRENVQALCGRCNSSKGIKTMEEWKLSMKKVGKNG